MTPKLDIESTRLPAGTWTFDIRHSGSDRAGRYKAVYMPSPENQLVMTSVTELRFPLSMSSPCQSVTDALEIIGDYFERHGCLA